MVTLLSDSLRNDAQALQTLAQNPVCSTIIPIEARSSDWIGYFSLPLPVRLLTPTHLHSGEVGQIRHCYGLGGSRTDNETGNPAARDKPVCDLRMCVCEREHDRDEFCEMLLLSGVAVFVKVLVWCSITAVVISSIINIIMVIVLVIIVVVVKSSSQPSSSLLSFFLLLVYATTTTTTTAAAAAATTTTAAAAATTTTATATVVHNIFCRYVKGFCFVLFCFLGFFF